MRAPESKSFSGMESIDSAAAAWLARRDAGFGADDEQEFEGWLRADPRHASAWAALISAWTAFDEPRRLGATGGMIRELAVRRRRRSLDRSPEGRSGWRSAEVWWLSGVSQFAKRRVLAPR